MKLKFAYLGVAALLTSFSANAAMQETSAPQHHMGLMHAKTLADVKVMETVGSHEGIVCAKKDHYGKFSYVAGKVYNPELKGKLDKEQQALFERFEAAKEGEKVEYSYKNMKKVAMVKKFGKDEVCAHVKPEGEMMKHEATAKPAEAKVMPAHHDAKHQNPAKK